MESPKTCWEKARIRCLDKPSGKIEAFKGHVSCDASDELTKIVEEEQEKF